MVDRLIVSGCGDLEGSRCELECADVVMVNIGSTVARYGDVMNMRKGVVR